jgi:aquaporin Z
MGLAMGGTAIALIFSPWGKRSGAHMNPATTLTFYRMGRVGGWDTAFYVLAQFMGGVAGTLAAAAILGATIAHPSVNYAVTVPGHGGPALAFVGELAIAFLLMLTVLVVSNIKRVARFTGLFAGALVALYIVLESPVSGMSLNPARTLGSAVPAMTYTALWIYFAAPLAGMLLAAETYVRAGRGHVAHCAKYHHENHERCIFRCRYGELR